MTDSVNDKWYENFFSGLNCEMWENVDMREWTQKEVEFLIKILEIQPKGTVLDIPCGYGRHAVELSKRGFQVTGVDISIEFLQTLQKRAAAEALSIKILEGNLLTMTFGHSFDGAYCLGNSFGYVDHEGMKVFVTNVASALKPGGRFVINSGMVAESILTHFPLTNRYVLGDLTMDILNSYEAEDSCMVTKLTYTKADRLEKHYFKHYVYTLAEIKRLLADCGLHTIAVFNSPAKMKYQLGDQQMYLVAEKQ